MSARFSQGMALDAVHGRLKKPPVKGSHGCRGCGKPISANKLDCMGCLAMISRCAGLATLNMGVAEQEPEAA